MSVVKRAVLPAVPAASLRATPDLDVEANVPAHFVSPAHSDHSSRTMWVVAGILAVAAVVVIVELLVIMGQQQEQFLRAVSEVEKMHHDGGAHDDSRKRQENNAVAAPVARAEEEAVFVLLDNDDVVMSMVKAMFRVLGYKQVHPWQDHIGKWNVLWAWRDPFHRSKLSQQLLPRDVRSGQLINRFPGASFTNKVDLVAFAYPFIPRAFMYPEGASQWQDYVKNTPGADSFVWVRKNTGHRGVVVTDPQEAKRYVDTGPKEDIFIQRFVHPPHLIEGRKWDIGVYVLVTSLRPLRVYFYDDLLVRFCKEPFPAVLDASRVDTYVIADDYTSPWDLDKFQRYKNSSTSNVKQWMDRYFAQMQPDLDWPSHLERHTTTAIKKVIEHDVEAMLEACEPWPDKSRQFFELFRFDFVFDHRLNPFLMEANMSPNLSPSAHPHLSTMFENILRDTAKITGIVLGKARSTSNVDAEFEMVQAGNWRLIE